MNAHEIWHVVVLATTLVGAAAAAILLIAPLAFGEAPPGLARSRRLLVGLAAFAGLVLLLEWLVVHPRWV